MRDTVGPVPSPVPLKGIAGLIRPSRKVTVSAAPALIPKLVTSPATGAVAGKALPACTLWIRIVHGGVAGAHVLESVSAGRLRSLPKVIA